MFRARCGACWRRSQQHVRFANLSRGGRFRARSQPTGRGISPVNSCSSFGFMAFSETKNLNLLLSDSAATRRALQPWLRYIPLRFEVWLPSLQSRSTNNELQRRGDHVGPQWNVSIAPLAEFGRSSGRALFVSMERLLTIQSMSLRSITRSKHFSRDRQPRCHASSPHYPGRGYRR